ncbi:hypothetical protein GOV12_00705 [Candidatus Pacearchaeota archaeon]|nr:hypothetical protein [Candidatus Pacearchaeota archaeon]
MVSNREERERKLEESLMENSRMLNEVEDHIQLLEHNKDEMDSFQYEQAMSTYEEDRARLETEITALKQHLKYDEGCKICPKEIIEMSVSGTDLGLTVEQAQRELDDVQGKIDELSGCNHTMRWSEYDKQMTQYTDRRKELREYIGD